MAKYYLTKKAVDDLAKIWDYTFQEWSEKQADKYYQMLVANFIEISQSPETGKNYTDIATSLFGLKVGKHIIFYRILNSGEVEITRILHEMMDLKRRLKE